MKRMTSIRLASLSIGMAVAASVTLAQTKGGAETGAQFYMKYRAAFDKAKSFEDIAPFMSAKSRKEMEARSADDRKKVFGLAKMLGAVQSPKVVKEEKTADGATLTVEGIDPMDSKKTTGTIKLVRENGSWKLDSESWSS
jgi:hypothetical protein